MTSSAVDWAPNEMVLPGVVTCSAMVLSLRYT
jgi:hypothetical protein